MKAVVLMFDSLNRHLLSAYGSEESRTPNFQRLADRCLTFDSSYVCSMPCMPARRDFHTGRPNFLHNGWCPLEPFDDSVPALLSQAGIYTHIVTDHYHYVEDNGVNYLTRYDSWEMVRGQEGDPCIGQVKDPQIPENINGKGRRQDWVNRPFFAKDEDHYQTKTIAQGLDFLERNGSEDQWLLQIECFDPHEPFFCDAKYKDLYPDDYDGPIFDWPGYRQVTESEEEVAHMRNNYLALLSKCDESLGKILDLFDERDLWKDTMLIVWTDHGFLLGEHGWWAKNAPPLYEEISRTPFFVWDPRVGARGERRKALAQPALDLGPTLLRFFGLEPTERMLGKDLSPALKDDTPVRDIGIFGYHGMGINATDGRYVYLREAVTEDNQPLRSYSLTSPAVYGQESKEVELLEGSRFSFTRGNRLLRRSASKGRFALGKPGERWLFDLREDPRQERPIESDTVEQRMLEGIRRLMRECEAPEEQFERLGL